jgi:transposase
MKHANQELKKRAVEAYKTGAFTQQQLADAYCVHYKTIQNWLKADANGEGQVPKPRGHRPRIFSKNEEVDLLELIHEAPSTTLEKIKLIFNKNCNVSVIHRTLARLGITYKKNSASIGTRARRYQASS